MNIKSKQLKKTTSAAVENASTIYAGSWPGRGLIFASKRTIKFNSIKNGCIPTKKDICREFNSIGKNQ